MVASGTVLNIEAGRLMDSLSPQQLDYILGDDVNSYERISEFLQDFYFTAGSMTVSAADGNSSAINPATGDSATVTITLSNPEGSVSLKREWATWRTNLQTEFVGSFR